PAPTVSPVLASEAGQPLLGLDLADAREIFLQYAAFVLDLGRTLDVLERTTRADSEVRAARYDAVGRGYDHFVAGCLIEAAMLLANRGPDPLDGQRARDEHGLAIKAGHTLAIVAQAIDDGFKGL